MPTGLTYELSDYLAVRAVVLGLSESALLTAAGTGWRGIYEPRQIVAPAPTPSVPPASPTLWARWMIEYSDRPETTQEGAGGDVTRQGFVRIGIRSQLGCPAALVLGAFQQLRTAFHAASNRTTIAYLVEDPSTPLGTQAGWMMDELAIRFVGV